MRSRLPRAASRLTSPAKRILMSAVRFGCFPVDRALVARGGRHRNSQEEQPHLDQVGTVRHISVVQHQPRIMFVGVT